MDDPTNADEDLPMTVTEARHKLILLFLKTVRADGSIVLEEDNSTVVSLERVESAKLKDAEKNIVLFKPSKGYQNIFNNQ